ncbi:Mitotic checkpoint serine/threonine-protein kinase BUB1 beta [Merluccius polli]|uniref:Mitotic checkpoint serine/threonine-protein kinase BUB1 beta n=1 Tax=Merluccius polli TaxID=89951 RepID=A0AA47NRT8_MERPO|nr:Mitotic checkpoint serine/threonine-protein kinase BUB1 beta [Merluccius polli]
MIAHAPQVCSPTQPESNQCDSGQGVVSQEQGAAPRPNHPGRSTGNKLSPVLEAHTTSSSLGSSVATDDPDTSKTGEDPPLRDPCSGETRKRLLDLVEVSSFPGYHTVGTPLPHVDQDTQLSLGGEVVFILSKLQEEEQFSVFSGLSQGKHMVLKVERSLLPWDFYVVSQLRRRLSPGDSAPLPHARCFLFLDACVTLYSVPRHRRLSEWVGLSEEVGVASVVSSLLLMMRTFHSSSLLLGALHTDSMLLLTHGDSGDSLLCVDLLSSLDLQHQTDLTSASQVPAALGYLQQGVLKTTDSPYQLDLVCLAEAVHLLLTKRKMVVVEEEDGWMVEELGRATARVGRKSLWRKLFHLLLNSSGGSSLSVLTQLLDLPVATAPGGHRDGSGGYRDDLYGDSITYWSGDMVNYWSSDMVNYWSSDMVNYWSYDMVNYWF